MYLNRSKTKMYCILVFLKYHVLFVSGCVPSSEPSSFKTSPSTLCLVTILMYLAKSRSICPRFLYATTLSSLIQDSPWSSPSYSPITTTGSSLSLKATNFSYVLRTPLFPSTPKSGNVCGRRYTKTKIPSWHPHLPISFALPSFSGQVSSHTHSQLEGSRTSQSNTSKTQSGVTVPILGPKDITPTPIMTRRHISQLSSTLIICVGLKYAGIDRKSIGKPSV